MAFVSSFHGALLRTDRLPAHTQPPVCAAVRTNKSTRRATDKPLRNKVRAPVPPASPSTQSQGPSSSSPPPRSPSEPPVYSPVAPEMAEGRVYAPRQQRGGGRRLIGSVRAQGRRYVRAPPNPPGLRVAAGSARGRTLRSPDVYLRPMMGKVREALFSMLSDLGALSGGDDAAVLDLFAGSGSVGIEALSRGMARAVFVDFARECVDVAVANAAACGFDRDGQVQGVCARVEDALLDAHRWNGGRPFRLITLTPPYQEVDYAQLLELLVQSPCVGEGTFVVIEYPVELKGMPATVGHRLIGMRNRRYGRTLLAVYACQPDVDLETRPEEFETSRRRKR